MLVIRYTGKGWLAFILFTAVGVACLMIASAFGVRDDAFLITFAVLYLLLGTPLHWRIGTNLNSRSSSGTHMFMSAPMEYWAVWYPTVAMVVFCLVLYQNGSTAWAWALGIFTLIGLIVAARLARRHWDRKHAPQTGEGMLLFGAPPGLSDNRRQLAAAHAWRYREHAPEIRRRWFDGYGAEVDSLAPSQVLAGEREGLPFTIFDTTENIGRPAYRRESLRTVCLVHLPVALPDARLRGRLHDEERLVGDMPPVAAEPPWNCDLLPRASALTLIETGEGEPMAAESDVPGFAAALVTEQVRRETLRCRIPGWRIHGRDLIFVNVPGAARSLTTHEALAVVDGLVAIAKAFPDEALRRFGQPPTTGLPLADPATARPG